MLKNYLKIAVRNLFRNKIYSLINIVGLAIGIAVSVLILLFVMHEYSYDKFHKNHQTIYRILAQFKMGDNSMQMNSFSPKLGPALKEYNAQVKEYVRVKTAVDKVVMKNPEKAAAIFYEKNFTFADPSFFTVFSFKLKEGNKAALLNKPFTMVISERAARKYFAGEDPVGKTLLYEGIHPMQITGVTENPPSNSTFNFDFVASSSTFPQLSKENKDMWDNAGSFNTYLLLDSENSVSAVEKNIKREGMKTGAFDNQADYSLETFASTHLGNNFNDSGNSKLISIFTWIAGLILFLALFNYMSLTTARATIRAKEVGVRKVVGADRSTLIKQFYVESFLICCIAFALGFVLVNLLRQPFYDLLDLRIDSAFLFSPSFIGFSIGLLFITAIIAGSYPALILSGYAPLLVLKGKFAGNQGGTAVRRIFMVFQFTVSITLIVCSLVVKDQLSYMQNKKLGLYKDQILNIPITKTALKNYFPLRNEIRELAGVQSVAVSNVGLFSGYNMFFVKNMTTGKDVGLINMIVDNNFVSTMGLKWKNQPVPGLWRNRNHLLINQAAIKDLGIKGNPVGQKIGDTDEVAGILSDFHFTSLQSEIKGIGLFVVNDTTNILKIPGGNAMIYARLDPKANIREKVDAIGRIFKKYDQEKPFEYFFLDDTFNATFKTEIRMAKMFSVFTAFAIFIACIGLFGLVTFTAETRTKEIGIRKVLGASVSAIVTLLSKDFMKLVFLSILFSLPIAWYLMDKWLESFPYRIRISGWILLTASVSAVVIALITVSFQSIKAALINPVKSLKAE